MNNIPSPLPKTSDEWLELEIKATGADKAPRITPQDLDAAIVDTEILKHVTKTGKVLRWAILTTRNGYAVVGRPSVSVSAENDRPTIGETVAVENSRNELWPLLGYELSSKLAEVEAKKLKYSLDDISIYEITYDRELNVKFKDGKIIQKLTVPDDLELAQALRYAVAQANKGFH